MKFRAVTVIKKNPTMPTKNQPVPSFKNGKHFENYKKKIK